MNKPKLKINELFSGIGAQIEGLKNINVFDNKVICTSDIDKDAMLSYAIIHCGLTEKYINNRLQEDNIPFDKIADWLTQKNIGYDYKKNKPYNWYKLTKTDKSRYKLMKYYLACTLSKNMGDISLIQELPYADLWTYSFPCQDISLAGKQAGIKEGTRSGLLLEVERLLTNAISNNNAPKYLLLENVKNLVGGKHRADFDIWLNKLDELGYNTYWKVINAKNCGIPQNRERVFAISIRKDIDTGYVFPEPFELKTRLKDILEDEVDEKFYISNDRMNVLLKNLGTSKLQKDSTNVNQIGNCVESKGSFKNPQRGRVYSENGCSPALNCVGGGGLEPKILQVGNVNPSGKGMNGNVFNQDGLSPTITTNKGEGPKILEPLIAASRGRDHENPSDRTTGSPTEQRLEINQNGTSNTITTVQKDNYVAEPQIQKVDIPQTVTVRKHEVDCTLLCECLRDYKSSSNFSNKEIAEQLDRPVTLVEHWFRRDKSFSIPDADIWFKLKELLNITTDEFDLPITEFIQQEGVYEKANRCYMVDGISPTITSASADEKIIEDYCIRKLTPKECWRLMGFTDEIFNKVESMGVSNSQLYKQAGNSIVVNCIELLMEHLYKVQYDKDYMCRDENFTIPHN